MIRAMAAKGAQGAMKMSRLLEALAVISLILVGACAMAQTENTGEADMAEADILGSRKARIVEADIIATHAWQALMHLSSARGEAKCWETRLSKSALEALVEHQKSLLSGDVADLAAWADGDGSAFDPSGDLDPILESGLDLDAALPVNVFTDYLLENTDAGRLEARAVASLYQTVLEVERDGTLLQEEFALYIAMDLPVYVGRLGLPGTDADLLEAGKALAEKTCASPFDTDPAAWQIAGRKVWNWGEKHLHIRDAAVIAGEMLEEDDVKALVGVMKAMPPQKIAILGHSFTSDAHWASPSAFVPIVTAIFERENPSVRFRQWLAGGLNAARAYRNFYDEAVAWEPDRVLFVMVARNDQDVEATKKMVEGFTAAGAEVLAFDSVYLPDMVFGGSLISETYEKLPVTIIEAADVIANAPERGEFVCLDGLHMREPYHRLMAKEWLEFLVGARKARLE